MIAIETMFTKAKTAALAKWRSWVHDIVDEGKAPAMLEVREAAELLGVSNALVELEADAKALRDVRLLEQRLAATKQAIADRTAADGDQATIRTKLAAAKAEVRRLEKLVGVSPLHYRVADLVRSVDTIRRNRWRVFDRETKRRPTGKKKTTSKQKVTA